MPSGPKSARPALKESGDSTANKQESLKTLGHFGGIGVEMAVFIVLGVKGGQWLDRTFDTEFCTLLGLGLGLFAGFRSLYQLTKRLHKRAAASEPTPG